MTNLWQIKSKKYEKGRKDIETQVISNKIVISMNTVSAIMKNLSDSTIPEIPFVDNGCR